MFMFVLIPETHARGHQMHYQEGINQDAEFTR